MATLEDEHTDAATHDIPDALTPPQRQSPGPMLHDVWRVVDADDTIGRMQLELVDVAVEVKQRGLAGRREAVQLATAETDDDRYGTFRVVKHGEMSDPIVREQVVEPRDKWS